MSVGRRIYQLRSESHTTQRELGEATGLAVSYLSRLENGRLTPTLPTLTKIAAALSVPLTALLEVPATLEARDVCPVSLSGRCLLDHPFVNRREAPTNGAEAYSREQLEALRLCNLILHSGDKQIQRTLLTLLKGLLALEETSRNAKSEKLARSTH